MKKNWKKVLVGTLCLVGFLLLLVKGNQFEKVSLISTEGQSYEKAVVTIWQKMETDTGHRRCAYRLNPEHMQGKSLMPSIQAVPCLAWRTVKLVRA